MIRYELVTSDGTDGYTAGEPYYKVWTLRGHFSTLKEAREANLDQDPKNTLRERMARTFSLLEEDRLNVTHVTMSLTTLQAIMLEHPGPLTATFWGAKVIVDDALPFGVFLVTNLKKHPDLDKVK